MKIVSLNPGDFGKELIAPFDGKITVSKEGIADVSEKLAHHLVKNNPFWAYEGQVEEKTNANKVAEPEPKGNEAELKAEVKSLKAEVEGLQKENTRLWEENATLKKSIAASGTEEAPVVAAKVATVAGDNEEPSSNSVNAEDEAAKQALKEELEAKLASMKKPDLRELCVEGKYDTVEWAELAVAELRAYILNKTLSE